MSVVEEKVFTGEVYLEELYDRCVWSFAVKAFYVYGEQIGIGGDSNGSDCFQVVVSVLYVAGLSSGEGAKVVVNEAGDDIWATVAIRDYGSTVRNFKGNRPCLGIFMHFGKEVEVVGAWVVWSKKKITLFSGDLSVVVEWCYNCPKFRLCVGLDAFRYGFVVLSVKQLSVGFQ